MTTVRCAQCGGPGILCKCLPRAPAIVSDGGAALRIKPGVTMERVRELSAILQDKGASIRSRLAAGSELAEYLEGVPR